MKFREIYERLMNDDSIVIEVPDCLPGIAYFTVEGVRYSCYWSEAWGVEENSIERELE